MLTIGSTVLTVEDISARGRLLAGRSRLRRTAMSRSDDWVILDPPVQEELGCPGREPRAVGDRVSAALPAADPPRHLRRRSGRRDPAAAGPRRTRGGLGRLSRRRRLASCWKTPRATGSASSRPIGRVQDCSPLSAGGTAERIASRSGLPLGSVARSSTSTRRTGRACGPISSGHRLDAPLRAAWTRSAAAPHRAGRRRRMPRPSEDRERPTTTADSQTRDAADDAFDAIERDVDPARDDDVVDAAAHAQHDRLRRFRRRPSGTTACHRGVRWKTASVISGSPR